MNYLKYLFATCALLWLSFASFGQYPVEIDDIVITPCEEFHITGSISNPDGSLAGYSLGIDGLDENITFVSPSCWEYPGHVAVACIGLPEVGPHNFDVTLEAGCGLIPNEADGNSLELPITFLAHHSWPGEPIGWGGPMVVNATVQYPDLVVTETSDYNEVNEDLFSLSTTLVNQGAPENEFSGIIEYSNSMSCSGDETPLSIVIIVDGVPNLVSNGDLDITINLGLMGISVPSSNTDGVSVEDATIEIIEYWNIGECDASSCTSTRQISWGCNGDACNSLDPITSTYDFPNCDTCPTEAEITYLTFSGASCAMEFYPPADFLLVEDPICQQWTVTGTENYVDGETLLILDGTQPFSVCYTACCEVAGEIQTLEECLDFPNGCNEGCDFDNTFFVKDNDVYPCQYYFLNISPEGESTEGVCATWYAQDEDGVTVATHTGVDFYHEFEEPGTYTVCYVACCTVGGVLTEDETCVEIEVESCDCIPPTEFQSITLPDDPCHYVFSTPHNSETPLPVCQEWTVTGPDVDETFSGLSFDYVFPGNGFYDVCYTACCTQGEEVVTAQECETIEINSCESCDFDNHLKYSQDEMHPCIWTFAEIAPQSESSEGICHSWAVTNESGEVINTWDDENYVTFEFPEAGTYSVCYIACCFINGVQTIDETCVEVEIESCDCIPDASFIYAPLPDDACNYAFLAQNSIDDSHPGCMQWTINGPGVNETLSGTYVEYNFPSNGTYTVCHRACCTTNGQTNNVVHCETIEVTDCEEECTPDGSFNISQVQGGQCCFLFESTGGNDWVDNGGCQVWRVSQNGAVIYSEQSETMNYCFTQQGQYTVCYRACCDGPTGMTTDTQCQNVSCGANPDNDDPKGGRRRSTIQVSVGNSAVVYPNPSTGLLNVQFSELVEGCTVSILDVAGKTLMREDYSISTNQIQLDASTIAPGSYHLRIESGGLNEIMQIVLVN